MSIFIRVEMTDDGLQSVISLSQGDMRRSVNILQVKILTIV